jgi:nucleoside-diphosphate-sugar epimerase
MAANWFVYKSEIDYRIEHLTTEPTGVHYRVGNPEKMHTFFTPTITLEQGIERALNWRRTH